MTLAISSNPAPSIFNHSAHHCKIFDHLENNQRLWIDLNQCDQTRLFEARKDYNHCKSALVIGEERTTALDQVASLVEKGAYVAIFGYQVAKLFLNPAAADLAQICSSGFQAALTGFGTSGYLINQIPYLPTSLPKMAGHALSLVGLGSQLTNMSLNRSQSLKAQAELKMRFAQMAHKEHLRLASAEMDTKDYFARQASRDESENHRILVEIFRTIASAKK